MAGLTCGAPRKVSDEAIAAAMAQHGSRSAAAVALGVNRSLISRRLGKVEVVTGLDFNPHAARLSLEVPDGSVLVGSDAHIWPGELSTAMRAFIHLAAEFKPQAVILNGDVFDGSTVSRHPSIGWEHKPTLVEELGACQAALREIKAAAPDARHIWTLGNHDLRFETRLVAHAPEFAGVKGVHLKDHFPDWEPCWSVWINAGAARSPVVVKHRYKGGTGATRSNTLHSGMSIVTGHLHALNVTRYSDYWGPRWGVDTGTLARPYGEQFVHYTEDNPVDWCAGFAVLTFKDGKLLWPELVYVVNEAKGQVAFRGERYTV